MKRLCLIAAAVGTVLLAAGIARAEVFGDGDLRVSFSGRISPHSLPRDRNVPVRVSLVGAIRTPQGVRPPQLRRISIAVNRYGRLSTRGLPRCPTGQLESTDTQTALERCGGALVGRGRFGATLESPSLPPLPVEGKVVAFHGGHPGRSAILLHIHASRPIEATVVLTFSIRHRSRGTFGTVLTTTIPRIAADLGYVTDLSLYFGRRYTAGGERRSFISARCAAPAGFPGALFTFARGDFIFAGGKRVTTTLARDCLVR
jgi:hypothetical protein